MKFWAKNLILVIIFFNSTFGSLEFYLKVRTPLHSTFSLCLISSTNEKIRDPQCVMKCQQTPKCSLACNSELSCNLYHGIVSLNWNPETHGVTDENGEEVDSACFSNWASKKDIISQASFSYSSTLQRNISLIADGFYCGGYATMFQTNGYQPTVNQWVQADLGSTKTLQKIAIKAGNLLNGGSWLHDIDIRVGNNIDFMQNAVIGKIGSSPVEDGAVMIFESSVPFSGRYVTVLALGQYQWTVVGELAIIEK